MASNKSNFALLVVVGEVLNEEQPLAIGQRIIEGLSAWDSGKAPINLNTELLNFVNKTVKPELPDSGGIVLRSQTSQLYVEFLIGATIQTLQSSLQHFLTQTAAYKHLIYAGSTFSNTGSWILHDGTLSMHDFARMLHSIGTADVALGLTEISKNTALVVSCFPEGEWNEQGVKHHGLDKYGHITIGILSGNSTCLDSSFLSELQSFLERYVQYVPFTSLMPTSNVVGSIRFRRPTIYVFPSGQGDAALFGVDGFLMLMDCGYQRRTCFWDFLRHVDHLDAILISRINQGNVFGAVSFLELLATTACAPKLAYAFWNVPEIGKPSGGQDIKNPLLISSYEEGSKIFYRLSRMGLKPQTCAYVPPPVTAKLPESITLYEKVGQGRLEMYVLNPVKESKEYAEFVETWKKRAPKVVSYKFSTKPDTEANDFSVPLSNRTSLAALIVWRPADPNERIVRVLYPGSCPQEKVLAGLERLKTLDFLKHPYCTAALLEKKPPAGMTSTKAAILTKKASAGKTAAELMAEGLLLNSALKPALLGSANNAKEPRGATPATPSPLSPLAQVQSPHLDSDDMDGGNMDEGNGGVDNDSDTAMNSNGNHQPGYGVDAEATVPSAYETATVTGDYGKSQSPTNDHLTNQSKDNDDMENPRDKFAGGDSTEAQPEMQKLPAVRSSSLNPDAKPFVPRHCQTSSDSSPDSIQDIGSFPSQESGKVNDGRDDHERNIDEVKQKWGEPMALPTVPAKKEATNNPTGAAKKDANSTKSTSAQKTGETKETSENKNGKPTSATTMSKAAVAKANLSQRSNLDKSKNTPISTKSPATTSTLKNSSSTVPKGTAAPILKNSTATTSKDNTAAPGQAPTTKTATRKVQLPATTSVTGKGSNATTRGKTTSTLKKQMSTVTYFPFYVDLTYIPHQGNPYYSNAEFFKYVRSKYYVLSSLNPPKETLDALLTGKKFWNMQDESTTIIPTYDSDTLALWMTLHKDELALENVDIAPSAVRCSVNLEEHTGATCSAYRLEL